jgi:hypothetical protein
MAIERGQQLSRGTRRTNVESGFGVVKSTVNNLGESLVNISEAADKITQFQVDVMDKEWQNNFDTTQALFIEEETRKELNSPNPDIIGLREKFLSYKDKSLSEAPKRFQNYIENKLDLNFSEQINNVKDYANNLRYNNLLTSNENLNNFNLNKSNNDIQKIINNNKGNLPVIQSLVEQYFLDNVTPNLSSVAEGNNILHQLNPSQFTPGMIEEENRKYMINYEFLRQNAVMEGIISTVNFENNDYRVMQSQINDMNDEMENYLESYLKNPDVRRIDNMSEVEVNNMINLLRQTKNNLLDVQQSKIDRAQNVEVFSASEQSKNVIGSYTNNAGKSLSTNDDQLIFQVMNDPLLQKYPSLIQSTISESQLSINIHKQIYADKVNGNGVLKESRELYQSIKSKLGLSKDELSYDSFLSYVRANNGGDTNLSAIDLVNSFYEVRDNAYNPDYGKISGPNFITGKSLDDAQREQNNLKNYEATLQGITNGIYPVGTKEALADLDRILMRNPDDIKEKHLDTLKNGFAFMNLIQGQNGSLLYNEDFGDAPKYFKFLENLFGETYKDINILEVSDGRSLVEQYQNWKKNPYTLEEVNNFMKTNNLDIGPNGFESEVFDDLKTQFGVKALGRWIVNQMPFIDEEDEYIRDTKTTEIFKVSGWKKFLYGMGLQGEGNLNIPPMVNEQFNQVFIQKLQNLVDFSQTNSDPEKLKADIIKNKELALEATAEQLLRDGFGVSYFEGNGNSGKVVQNPIEDQLEGTTFDKQTYIARDVYNRLKEIETEEGSDYMDEYYKGLYYSNLDDTDRSNRLDLTYERVFDMVKEGYFYFTKVPGYDVYTYNISDYVQSDRKEMNGEGDQYFIPNPSVARLDNGEYQTKASIVAKAVKDYLDNDSLLMKVLQNISIENSYLNETDPIKREQKRLENEISPENGIDPKKISTKGIENILFSIFNLSVKGMTTEKEIINHIKNNTKSLQ